MRHRVLLSLLVITGLVAACGGDDDSAASDPTTTDADTVPETIPDTLPETTASPATTADAASSSTVDATPTSEAAVATTSDVGANAFPVTIEHKYGETTIEAPPERVVAVGYVDQDALLALGVVPIGIRDWYGDQPYGTWPWAIDLLGDAEPTVLASTEPDFETIAALRPDLIIGLSSGMTQEHYDLASQVAPTIAQSGDYIDFGQPWQEGTLMVGRAVGKADEAQQLVDDVEAELAAVAAAHPEWEGQEVAVAYVLDDSSIGAYPSSDSRPALLAELGFVTPAEFDELAGDSFYTQFSWEEINRVDRDVLMWITSEPEVVTQIQENPLRGGLSAAQEGREIFLGQIQAGAFSFSSVLSIPYLLDTLVPQLEAAVDADPATEVPLGE